MDLFIKWMQMALTAHGFTPGAIDGIDGPKTRRALRAFQTANGIEITGTATEATVVALRADPTAGEAAMPERDDDGSNTPQAVSPVWPRQKDVPEFYGGVGERQTRIEVPFDMWLAWDTGTRLRTMTLHERVSASAERVLNDIADIYSSSERQALGIDQFGGSLAVRKMRGGSRWSMHSWGIAIDFDPIRNGLRTKKPQARLSHPDAEPFWRAWEDEGWVSLGRARNYDWMHVQAARL